MRTAIVCGAGVVFGKETIALELGEGLRASGVDVNFVTSLWGDGAFRKQVHALGFPVHSMRLGFISATLTFDCMRMTADQMWRWPGLLVDYRRLLRSETPRRVIHTNWHHLLLLLPFLKPERDLFWLHEMVPDKPQYRRVFGWLSRRLGCFVPVSQAVAGSLRSIGVAPEKIRVIHNGYKDPVAVGAGRKARKGNTIRIGIAGQMTAGKGHQDLFDAFALIAHKHPAAELNVFGRGQADFERELRARAKTLGIDRRVAWPGYVPERASLYSDVDVFVVPSRAPDALPGVAVEAAFFGLPVVASRCGGLPEIIEDGVTGFLVEPANPQQLAVRLDELLQSAERRRSMGAAARRRATAHFGRGRFVGDFVRLLNGDSASPTIS